MSTQQSSIENYIKEYENTVVFLLSVSQTTWENALKPLQQQSPGLPLARSLCKTEVSFHLPMAWLGVLSLLKNTI